MDFTRIVCVGYEPWETELAHHFLEKLKSKDPQRETSLIIADPHHPINNKAWGNLQEMAAHASHNTEVVFRDLMNWQTQIPALDPADVTRRLEEIVTTEGIDSLHTITASDLHLVPRERSPFYWPLNDRERAAASLLVFERVLEIFEQLKPDVVVMMWDQYLAKNFIGALCRARGIPIRVFRRVRFRDYLKLDYFFLPLDPSTDRSLLAPTPQGSIRAEIENFGDSLYPKNLAVQDASFVELCHSTPFQAIRDVLRRGMKAQRKFSRRGGRQHRNRENSTVRYWVSRSKRVRVFITLRMLRNLRYVLDRRTLATEKKLPERYILVPLHFRPESAILTQGRGIEDDDVVREVAAALRTYGGNVSCVVLEHPTMIGDRRYSFYRKLKNFGPVVIADPVVSTQKLIRGALGVVTISGTIGLEASIAGIPVHVAGHPEFVGAIQSRGVENIERFTTACVTGDAPSSREDVLSYLEKHSQAGWTGDLGWSAIRSETTRDQLVDRLVEMFTRSATNSSR